MKLATTRPRGGLGQTLNETNNFHVLCFICGAVLFTCLTGNYGLHSNLGAGGRGGGRRGAARGSVVGDGGKNEGLKIESRRP